MAATTAAARERSRVHAGALPIGHTVGLAAVLVVATLYGLLDPEAYRVSAGVRDTLPETLRGQDLLTLLTVPVLVWAAIRGRAGSLRGHLVWTALCLYVAYSYLMYVVVPFNDAFLLYVAAIGLASVGLLHGLLRIDADAVAGAFGPTPRRGPLAWFLLVVGAGFGALWLAQILAAFPGDVPDGLFVYDIPSTVHVLDLAFVLPLVITTGVLLLRRHPIAPALTALVLVKMVTLGLALLFMNGFVFAAHGQLNVGEVGMWATVTAVASGWLVAGARSVRPVTTPWLRPTLWPVSAGGPTAPGGAAVRPPPTGPGGPARPVSVPSSWAPRT